MFIKSENIVLYLLKNLIPFSALFKQGKSIELPIKEQKKAH